MSDNRLTGYPSKDKPWLKYYSEEAKNTPLPECSLFDYLWEKNRDYPKDIALEYLGKRITFGELFMRIDEAAAAFAALGVKPKEIVTVALPSLPEALYAVYALNKIGAAANMIHPLAGRAEIIDYLNEVGSRVAVLFEGTYRLLEGGLSATGVRHAVIVSAGCSLPFGIKQLYSLKNRPPKPMEEGTVSWKSFISAGRGTPVPQVKKDVNDIAVISHTGGTTGEPKGVMCSDKNCNSLMYQIVCNFRYERQGVCLSVLPPFINYSLIESMMAMLAIGYKVVLIPDYKQSKFMDYAKKYSPNIVLSIPPYWEALLEPGIRRSDLSCLEQAYYGGEGMNPEKEDAVNEVLAACGAKIKLCKGLGSTEMVGGATQSYNDCNVRGSAGIPLVKVDCGIFDPETGEEKRYNEVGEICLAGSTLMLGYYNKPEETAKVVRVHPDGKRWLHTADLGYLDEEGILFVTGRMKRIIITKGKDGIATKLFPDRIEKVIGTHPAVRSCCVVAVPDEKRVNWAKAYVELNEGFEFSDALARDICRSCRDKLPDYQIPDEGEFIAEMPRTERGKVDYRALEKLAAEKNKATE